MSTKTAQRPGPATSLPAAHKGPGKISDLPRYWAEFGAMVEKARLSLAAAKTARLPSLRRLHLEMARQDGRAARGVYKLAMKLSAMGSGVAA